MKHDSRCYDYYDWQTYREEEKSERYISHRQHDNPVVFRPQQHAIKQQQQQQQQQQNKDKSKKMSAHPIQGKRKSSCFS